MSRVGLPLILLAPLAVFLGLRALAGTPAAAPDGTALAPPPPSPTGEPLDVDERLRIAPPITQGLVALYPVIDRETPERPEGDFLLLKDALAAKTLTVEESGEGSVPTLLVKNTGVKPVLVVAGDVVQGGKQDRVVTSDFVVQADGKPVDIAVNCVEHGRWSAGATGKSFGYGGRGEGSLKKVVQVAKNQSDTWAEVASSNDRKARLVRAKGKVSEADKLAPSTGTYMASLENAAVKDEVEPHTAALIDGLKSQDNVVGVVVAVGGSITTAEVFGHPALFETTRDDLVRSFVMDGVGAEDTGNAPPAEAAASFLREAMAAAPVSETEDALSKKAEKSAPSADAFETTTKEGKRIHFNAYAK